MARMGTGKQSPTLLLVEDNPAHAEMIIRSFNKHANFLTICHFADGESALNYLFQSGAYADSIAYSRPDIILLDLRLPRVSGIDILREIKSSDQLSDIPVVVLTSSNTDRDIRAAYTWHVNSYLMKPLDFKAFEQMISDFGRYWLGWNLSPFKAS